MESIDLVEKGKALKLVAQDGPGKCGTECRTVAKACEARWAPRALLLPAALWRCASCLRFSPGLAHTRLAATALRGTPPLRSRARVHTPLSARQPSFAAPWPGNAMHTRSRPAHARGAPLPLPPRHAAAQEVLGDHDTDLAEAIFAAGAGAGRAWIESTLCRDLSSACAKPPPPLPPSRPRGPAFEPKTAQEAEMDKLMRSMAGVEGMPGACVRCTHTPLAVRRASQHHPPQAGPAHTRACCADAQV
jgi:hypothetical protein